MKKKEIAGVLCVMFFCLIAGKAAASDHGDWQLWSVVSVEGKLDPKWSLPVEQEFRWGDNVSDFYYTHTDLGIKYKMEKWLDLSVHYRQVFEKKNDKWLTEYRPHLNANLKAEWKGFKGANRTRLEYRIYGNTKDDAWRIRNKTTVSYPFIMADLTVAPYLADEIFVPSDKLRIDKNRIYAGFKCAGWKHLKAEVFYMLETGRKNADKWHSTNVLGINLGVMF